MEGESVGDVRFPQPLKMATLTLLLEPVSTKISKCISRAKLGIWTYPRVTNTMQTTTTNATSTTPMIGLGYGPATPEPALKQKTVKYN